MRNFNAAIIACVTMIMLVLDIPVVFRTLIAGPLVLPEHVARLTYRAVLLLLPWLVKSGEPRITDTAITRTTTTMTICRLLRRISTTRQCYA